MSGIIILKELLWTLVLFSCSMLWRIRL